MLVTLEKILLYIGLTPNMKLKLVLNITNYLTKSSKCLTQIIYIIFHGQLVR